MTAKRLVIAVFSVLLLAVAAYAVYWRVFATRIPDIIATWAAQQRARGYVVSYGKIAVTGFPGVFRVSVVDPVLARADTRAVWRWHGGAIVSRVGPFDFRATPFRVTGGSNLTYAAPPGARPVAATAARLSGRVMLTAGGQPDDGVLKLEKLRLRAPDDAGGIRAASARVEARWQAPTGNSAHNGRVDFTWTVSDIDIPKGRAGPLGPRVRRFSGATSLTRLGADLARIDDPRAAIIAWRDGKGKLLIHALRVAWGPLLFQAEGTLALDKDMRPLGTMRTRTQGYREILAALVRKGLVPRDRAAKILLMLNFFSRKPAGGGPREIALPLAARDGALYLGPVKLAPLPPLSPPR